MKPIGIDLERVRYFRLSYAGLLAACFTTITFIFQLETVSTPLYVTLYAFGVAIPLQALGIATADTQVLLNTVETKSLIILGCIDNVAVILVCVGFVALFWHFSAMLGVLTGVAVIASLIVWHWHAKKLQNILIEKMK